jgi:hypothetical protein
MSKKSVYDCKNKRDFLSVAGQYSDVEIIAGKGSHTVVKTPRGASVVPNGEIRKGTRFAIIKQFVALGITIFFIGYFLVVSGIL